ncbi:MAG: hypothetical protein Q9M14_00895 [Mariprofundaceae bacterium]|nr:hypothetical protein [Mariprofundaceae bacterium]
MTDKKETTAAPSDDAIVIEENSLEDTSPENLDIKKEPAQPRRWPLFILAFIVGSATSIFALNYYQQNYLLKPHHVPIAITSLPDTSHKSDIVELVQNKVSKPVDVPALKAPISTTIPTPISSEEGEALIAAITTLQESMKDLQGELQVLREQQHDVAHSQSMLESMQLHSRLTWIMKHNSHLPQIKLAWQEISLLPSLTTEQRSQAETMLKLAEERQNDVQQWQQEIDHLIIILKPDEYDNIISTAITANNSNPWLEWLIKQFSLKRSQSSQEAALLALKNALLHTKQGMNLEQWPTGTAWTELRAQLQLRLLKHFNTNKEEVKQAGVLQLPESFDAIQADVKKLRQAAQSWLEES